VSDHGQLWAEPELEIDDQSERADPVTADEEIRVLAKASRLAVRCDSAVRHHDSTPGTDIIEFPLRCVAHPHPECRFRWTRVTLDLSGTVGASITDLSPREEVSEHPVKVTTRYSGGLKFDIAMIPAHPELSAERTAEQHVYFPKITVSGIGFSHAIWDFTAVGEEPLTVDRPLRLLATVPATATQVPARLTLRAAVTARGLPGWIPLIGRQAKTIPLQIQA